MTDMLRIKDALCRIYDEEGARIVFWNDPEKEFQTLLSSIELPDVNIVQLDRVGALEIKIRIEQDDSAGRFLLYSPAEEPDYEDDWLLDMRLFSRSFRADRASIILHELGLQNQMLRQHLADRRKFFDNKERLQKLKPLVTPTDTANDLDRKMIAILAKGEQPEIYNILRTLFHDYTETGRELDLDNPTANWMQIEKFDLAQSFWEIVKSNFGYAEEQPTLKNLLIRLMVTDYAHHLKSDLPTALANLVLPAQGQSNAVVFLAQWRDSSSKGSSYDLLSSEAAALIHLDEFLSGLTINELLDVMTFLAVEKTIASRLRGRVQNTADAINAEDVRSIALRRQAGHWASLTVVGDSNVPRKALNAVYDAVIFAADFFALRNQHRLGFDFTDAASMYGAYESELYNFDQLYRRFCEAADIAESQAWNILKPLREDVEACYANWFIPMLALAWGKFLEPTGSTALLNTWRIDKVPNQQDFFDRHVQPRLDEAEKRKVYVIISDAFRYEAAQELARELNGKYRFEAALSSQLGVLPSYTGLGIASLLPHQYLAYKSSGDILADGKPTKSMEQRGEVLSAVEGMACKASALIAMKKDDGREFVSRYRVIYVYHDAVDAVGDSPHTEEKTFQGVRTAIDELENLIGYIINSLNGTYVVITADHGFLYTESAPTEPDKSKIDQMPQGTIHAKKRYLIGYNLPESEAAWHGRTEISACAEGQMEYWIPKAANRFHFVGGARFVHGGAMLQEIVVPVITVRQIKGKSAKETKVKPVTVSVLGASHKITTNLHRFELIQVEPVSERVKPVILKVAVYEGDEPVTNIEKVTFESSSDKMDERKKWVRLTLSDRVYRKTTSYRLVLRDSETDIEQASVSVTIDRAFTDDF